MSHDPTRRARPGEPEPSRGVVLVSLSIADGVFFSFRYAVSGYRTFSGGWSSSIETMLNEFGVLDSHLFQTGFLYTKNGD